MYYTFVRNQSVIVIAFSNNEPTSMYTVHNAMYSSRKLNAENTEKKLTVAFITEADKPRSINLRHSFLEVRFKQSYYRGGR